jgi:Zn finger protein HypA/HybF involved in hydrogenase expression
VRKVQESKILGYQTVAGKKVPVVQPEVYQRIYCKNCDNEVDSEEQAVGSCSDCGQDWSVHKAKDIQVKVVQIPIGSGTG